MRRGIAFIVSMGLGTGAFAQSPVPPDPATVTLPDMTPTRDPDVIRDGWRHFYFHKAGVSYAEAYADFADCYRYLPVSMANADLPAFVPWSETPGVSLNAAYNPWGMVGAVMISFIMGPLDRRARQSRMRRCMEPRGYVRYPVSEEVWEALIDNYSEQSIARQARAASGPTPGVEPVTG
jgi:hypothetical protein